MDAAAIMKVWQEEWKECINTISELKSKIIKKLEIKFSSFLIYKPLDISKKLRYNSFKIQKEVRIYGFK